MNQSQEPVATLAGITLGSITALVAAILICLNIFDLYDVSAEQTGAVIGMVAALWAVVVPMVYAIRGTVYSPASVEEIKIDLGADPAAAK